jgi:DNA-directed RNA polymerase specialized sigma24 family protein
VLAVDDGPDPRLIVERAEQYAAYTALLARLKPDERTALLLLALGYSYREIGELRGWTHTKVNRCLSEGRAALRESGSGEARDEER